MTAPQSTDHVYRVTYRTEAGRVGSVLLIAGDAAEAVDKLRARDSLMANAPRMVAVRSSGAAADTEVREGCSDCAQLGAPCGR